MFISLFVRRNMCNQLATVLILKTNHNYYYCHIYLYFSIVVAVSFPFRLSTVFVSIAYSLLCISNACEPMHHFFSAKHIAFVMLKHFMFDFVYLNDNFVARKRTHQVSTKKKENLRSISIVCIVCAMKVLLANCKLQPTKQE